VSVLQSREQDRVARRGPEAPEDAEASDGPGAGAPAGEDVDRLLAAALAEDRGTGDVTTDVVIPDTLRAVGRLVAKARGVVCGLSLFARVFELLDPAVEFRPHLGDGERVAPGDVLAELEGRARPLLVGERTALNVLQRLSGVATRTRAFVDRAAGRVRVLDTRKTTPGFRRLEKYAVRCGGGENHRMGLDDEVLLKNNHVDLAGRGIVELLAELRSAHGPTMRITAEARDEREALDAVRGGADVVLLDNLPPDVMAGLCPRMRAIARSRPLEIEASGGVDLTTLDAIAASGVDRVSVGALTHSAPALDLALHLEARP